MVGSNVRLCGFGFRVSGFGFRSVLGKLSLQSRFRVSGFGFRVSIGPGEVKSSESVSGFGFRVSQFETNFNSRFRVSGFGFRWSKPTLQTSLRITSLICGPALHGSCFGGEHFAYIIAITIHPRQPHPRHHSNNPMIVPHPHPPLHHDPPPPHYNHHLLLLHQDPVRKECFLCAVLLVTYDHNGIPLFPCVCCQVIANTISMNVGRFISKLLLRTPDAPRTQSGACISIGVHFLLQAYG